MSTMWSSLVSPVEAAPAGSDTAGETAETAEERLASPVEAAPAGSETAGGPTTGPAIAETAGESGESHSVLTHVGDCGSDIDMATLTEHQTKTTQNSLGTCIVGVRGRFVAITPIGCLRITLSNSIMLRVGILSSQACVILRVSSTLFPHHDD